MRRIGLAALCVAAALSLFACGDQNQVGSAGLLKIPTPSPVKAAPSPSPLPQHVTAPSPVVQRTNQPPPPVQSTATIAITGNSPYFTPQNVSVGHGTIVKFVNQDQQPDQIQIQAGGSGGTTIVTSPSIAPGGTWTYTFSNRGVFGIGDRRPYATGQVTVT